MKFCLGRRIQFEPISCRCAGGAAYAARLLRLRDATATSKPRPSNKLVAGSGTTASVAESVPAKLAVKDASELSALRATIGSTAENAKLAASGVDSVEKMEELKLNKPVPRSDAANVSAVPPRRPLTRALEKMALRMLSPALDFMSKEPSYSWLTVVPPQSYSRWNRSTGRIECQKASKWADKRTDNTAGICGNSGDGYRLQWRGGLNGCCAGAIIDSRDGCRRGTDLPEGKQGDGGRMGQIGCGQCQRSD
jgi:hypothetical protein